MIRHEVTTAWTEKAPRQGLLAPADGLATVADADGLDELSGALDPLPCCGAEDDAAGSEVSVALGVPASPEPLADGEPEAPALSEEVAEGEDVGAAASTCTICFW